MPASLHKAEKATHAEQPTLRELAGARSVQIGQGLSPGKMDSSSQGPKVVIYHGEAYDLQALIDIEDGVPSILAGDASVIAKIGEQSPAYLCLNEWRDDEDFAQSLRRVCVRPELKAVLAAEEARELFSGGEVTSELVLSKLVSLPELHAAAGPLEADDGMAAFLRKLGTEQDGLCRAIRWAIRLGFTEIGLLDLRRHAVPRGFGHQPDDDPPDDLASAERLDALQALRNELLSVRGTFLISILDAGSELAKRGVFPYRSAGEFLHARRLEAVLCPLTPREVSRAVANLKLWTGPEFAPYLSIPDTPSVDLVYVFNCAENAGLREQLESTFRDCQPLPRMFRQLKVEFLNLVGEDDLYIRIPTGPAPRYGYKAGPNLLFFGSLLKLRGYKGFAFLMETDCTPVQPGWVQLLDRTCNQKSDAWLIGSLYRGAGILGNSIRRHLNGNALYAVGNEDFWNFLDPSYLLWLESKVKHSDPNLAFDCAWEAFIEESSAEKLNDIIWSVTQHIYSKFVSCDEIVNIAGGPEISGDVVWSLGHVRAAFPECAVVHGPLGTQPARVPSLGQHEVLRRLGRHHLFHRRGAGLDVASPAAWGQCEIRDHFHWRIAGTRGHDSCEILFKLRGGRIRRGDHISAKLSFRAARAVRLRIGIAPASADDWEGVSQEVALRGISDFEELHLEQEAARHGDGYRVFVEPASGHQEFTDLHIDRIDLKIASPGGETATFTTATQGWEQYTYGYWSGIRGGELLPAPEQDVPAPAVSTAASVVPEPFSPTPLDQVATPRPAPGSRHIQVVGRRSEGDKQALELVLRGPIRRAAGPKSSRLELVAESGRPSALRIDVSHGGNDPVSAPRRAAISEIPLADGRGSLVRYLTQGSRDGAAEPDGGLSPDVRAVLERLLHCWGEVDDLALHSANA